MMRKFEDIQVDGKCEVCGQEGKVVVLASSLGPCSFAYCKECLHRGLEPYSIIIGCYSNLDLDTISKFADKNERILLDFYHKTKEEFIKDCEDINKQYIEHCNLMS